MALRHTQEKEGGMEMTIGSRRALTVTFALATASALAATGLQFDPAITVSTNDAANNAFKAKMGWISYKSGPTQAQYDVKAQIMVYADGAAGGQSIWIARSVDNGASWGQQKITTSGGMSTGLIVDPVAPTNTGTFTINHNKPNIYVAPIGVINVGKGADALATWTSSDCSDTGSVTGDLAGPTPAQRINTNLALPQPFMCLCGPRVHSTGASAGSNSASPMVRSTRMKTFPLAMSSTRLTALQPVVLPSVTKPTLQA